MSHHCFGKSGVSRDFPDRALTSSSGTSPGSPEHALDTQRIPVSKEKRRIRSGRQAGCPTGRPDGPLRLLPRPGTLTSRQDHPPSSARRHSLPPAANDHPGSASLAVDRSDAVRVRGASTLKMWVKMPQLDPGVRRHELPDHPTALGVPGALSGSPASPRPSTGGPPQTPPAVPGRESVLAVGGRPTGTRVRDGRLAGQAG